MSALAPALIPLPEAEAARIARDYGACVPVTAIRVFPRGLQVLTADQGEAANRDRIKREIWGGRPNGAVAHRRARIRPLLAEGCYLKDICRRLGVSGTEVHDAARHFGLSVPHPGRLSAEEEARLADLSARGYSPRRIGEIMGARSAQAVRLLQQARRIGAYAP